MVCPSATPGKRSGQQQGIAMPIPRIETLALPPASMGTARSLNVIRYGSRGNSPKAYLQAGLHADEAPGFLVMHHLLAHLDRAQDRGDVTGEIILVPAANPIGLSQWRDELLRGRFDCYDSINFNRRHLDLTDPIAERIGDRLGASARENIRLIRTAAIEVLQTITPDGEAESLKHRLLSLSVDADIVLDLHCDEQAVMHVYLGTPLWPDAADLSAQLGAGVTLLADDSGVTPFDEACSRLWWRLAEKFPGNPIPPACLSATVELRGSTDVNHAMAGADAHNLLLFLQRRGLLRGDAPDLPALGREATPLEGVAQIKSSVPGVVVFKKEPGDWVETGEVVAEVVNPLGRTAGERLHALISPTAGVLFARKNDRYARPGRILAKIAGTVPLKKKGENLLTL